MELASNDAAAPVQVEGTDVDDADVTDSFGSCSAQGPAATTIGRAVADSAARAAAGGAGGLVASLIS
jgi:hypothetical protein